MIEDTLVVIPSREMDNASGCLSFDEMLRTKRAIGFIGNHKRVTKLKHIAIVDKGNKVYFADIDAVYVSSDGSKAVNTNDVTFTNVRHVPLSVLTSAGIDVNSGRCSIRYAVLAEIVDNLTAEDTNLLSLFG